MDACSFSIPMTAISYSKKSTTVASLPLRGSEVPDSNEDNLGSATTSPDSPDFEGAAGPSRPSKPGPVRTAPEPDG
jgi:hypothetical protein